jgi:hypothetical protein
MAIGGMKSFVLSFIYIVSPGVREGREDEELVKKF